MKLSQQEFIRLCVQATQEGEPDLDAITQRLIDRWNGDLVGARRDGAADALKGVLAALGQGVSPSYVVAVVAEDFGLDLSTEPSATGAAGEQAADDPDAKYLVWSHDAGTWWGPNGGAYTGDILRAGRYTLAEAQRCAGMRSWSSPNRPPEVVVAAPSPELLASPDLSRVMDRWIRASTKAAITARAAGDSRRPAPAPAAVQAELEVGA